MRDLDTTPPASVDAVSGDDAFDTLAPWETASPEPETSDTASFEFGAAPPQAASSEPTATDALPGAAPPPSQPEPRRSSPRRAADDEIYAALRAGEAEGASAAELCETYGITLPTYCVWKRKYGSLTFEELQAARRGEARRRRTFAAAIAGGAIVCAGTLWLLVMPARSIEPGVTSRASEAPAAAQGEQPARKTRQIAPGASAAPAPATPPPAPQAAANSQPVRPQSAPLSHVAPPLDSDDLGIVVQVMAAPTWEEAKAALESLRTAGHRAYALAVTVGDAPVYRVRIGPFDTRRAATEAIRELERDGYAQPWIVR